MNLAEHFEQASLWPLFLALPAAALALHLLDARSARRRQRLLGSQAESLRERSGSRPRALALLGSACALVAALQPLWGTQRDALAEPALDLVLCLDVSRSMLAQDVAPSRLERAQFELEALAQRAAGAQLALLTFAGEARIAVPWSADGALFAQLAGV